MNNLLAALTAAVLISLGVSASGATPPALDYVRSSQYVTVRDGTRLAIDILHPANAGTPVADRFPIVLVATPYQRAIMRDGHLLTQVELNATFRSLVQNGYVLAVLDIRGRGASFGDPSQGDSGLGDRERQDLYDVIEWLSAQPWSTGAVGMSGCSYVATTVQAAVSVMPPHLKAIAPTSSPIDSFGSTMRPGGVNQVGWLAGWDERMRREMATGIPVDEDRDGAILKSIVAKRMDWLKDHPYDIIKMRLAQKNRDTPVANSRVASDWNFIDNYKIMNLPMLQIGGWYDIFSLDTFRWQKSVAARGLPTRLVVGPWWHCQWYNSNPQVSAEHVNWFDRYLKGAPDAPLQSGLRYYVMGAPSGQEWRDSDTWPPRHGSRTTYYFDGAKSGSIASLNDGSLAGKINATPGAETYKVDYTVTSTGLSTRWNVPRDTGPQLDTTALDQKSVTYTTSPLSRGTEFTGTPVVSIWTSASTGDPHFYFYLSVVDKNGKTTLVTDGQIRAANRNTRRPPWPDDGLPWQASFSSDEAPLRPGEPVKIDLALFPTSFYVKPGERVRLTINNFDRGNFATPVESPAPEISIYRGARYPSQLTLTRRDD